MHFDFLSRLKRRGLEIIGSDATIAWQSSGRAPEVCEVFLGNQHDIKSVFQSDAIDPFVPYMNMLKQFLSDGNDLQSGEAGSKALEVALAASSPEWVSV